MSISTDQNFHSKTVIILGMHRSGTSALTGMLEEAGLYLGDVSNYSIDNRKGNRELSSIMTLHEDLLQRNDGRWNDPPDRVDWSPVHYALRDSIIHNYMNHSMWGFKDPRTVLVLGPWLKAIPNANLVGIFRHPYRVANSLNSRNEISLPKALELWVKYNRVLLWHYKNTRSFPIIEFTADEFAFKNSVDALTIELGLGSSHDEFFDHSLISTAEIDEEALKAADCNSNALRVYEKLKSISN